MSNIIDLNGNGDIDAVFARAVMSISPQLLGNVFSPITGATITLPSAGAYRIYYHLRGVVDAESLFITARLFNVTAGTLIIATESIPNFVIISAANLTNLQGTASMEVVLTVTDLTVINLEAKGSAATGTEVRNDTSGRTVIGFNKLGTGVFLNLKIIPVTKTGSFQVADIDLEKTLVFDIGAANDTEMEIPLDATLPIPVGSWIVGRKRDSADTSNVKITKEGGGITFNTPLGNIEPSLDSDGTDGATFFAEKIDTDTWNITGNLKA